MSQDIFDIKFADRVIRMSAVNGADYIAAEVASGSYEAPLPILVMAFAQRLGGCFVDVGANNGLYTLLATSARNDLAAIAFEPHPPAAAVFRNNMILNARLDRVELSEAALSDADGDTFLYVPETSHGLLETSSSLEPTFKAQAGEAIRIQKRRLDALDLPPGPLMVKVDIEGHEASFFRGAYATISARRPVIFSELLTLSRGDFYSVGRTLRELDYSFFQLRPDLLRKVDFLSYNRLTLNYLLLPNERFAQLEEICQMHALELTCDLLF